MEIMWHLSVSKKMDPSTFELEEEEISRTITLDTLQKNQQLWESNGEY